MATATGEEERVPRCATVLVAFGATKTMALHHPTISRARGSFRQRARDTMRAATTSALSHAGSVVAEAFRNVGPKKDKPAEAVTAAVTAAVAGAVTGAVTGAAAAPTGAPSALGLADSSDDEEPGDEPNDGRGGGLAGMEEDEDLPAGGPGGGPSVGGLRDERRIDEGLVPERARDNDAAMIEAPSDPGGDDDDPDDDEGGSDAVFDDATRAD